MNSTIPSARNSAAHESTKFSTMESSKWTAAATNSSSNFEFTFQGCCFAMLVAAIALSCTVTNSKQSQPKRASLFSNLVVRMIAVCLALRRACGALIGYYCCICHYLLNKGQCPYFHGAPHIRLHLHSLASIARHDQQLSVQNVVPGTRIPLRWLVKCPPLHLLWLLLVYPLAAVASALSSGSGYVEKVCLSLEKALLCPAEWQRLWQHLIWQEQLLATAKREKEIGIRNSRAAGDLDSIVLETERGCVETEPITVPVTFGVEDNSGKTNKTIKDKEGNIEDRIEDTEVARFRAFVLEKQAEQSDVFRTYQNLINCDLTLRRFLNARPNDFPAARSMLIEHLVWRRDHSVDSITSRASYEREDFRDIERHGVMYWHGHDADGRPTLVWRAELHYPSQVCPQKRTRYLVYLIELGLQRYGTQQINVIFDCTNVSWRNADMPLVEHGSKVLSNNYPGRIHSVLILPCGFLVSAMWRAASVFLAPTTRERFRLLKSTRDLAGVLPPAGVEGRLGGTGGEAETYSCVEDAAGAGSPQRAGQRAEPKTEQQQTKSDCDAADMKSGSECSAKIDREHNPRAVQVSRRTTVLHATFRLPADDQVKVDAYRRALAQAVGIQDPTKVRVTLARGREIRTRKRQKH